MSYRLRVCVFERERLLSLFLFLFMFTVVVSNVSSSGSSKYDPDYVFLTQRVLSWSGAEVLVAHGFVAGEKITTCYHHHHNLHRAEDLLFTIAKANSATDTKCTELSGILLFNGSSLQPLAHYCF